MNKEKLSKLLHYQVPSKVVNTLGFFALFCFSCLLFVCNVEAIAVVDESLNAFSFWSITSYGVYAYITFIIIFGVLYCLIGNLFISYVVLEIMTICWGIANRILFFTRDQFITISDFDVLGEAAAVKVDIGMVYHPIIAVLFIIGSINGVFLWFLTRKMQRDSTKRNRKNSLIIRSSTTLVLAMIFIFVHARHEQLTLDNVLAYRTTGGVVWFCKSLFGNATEVVSYEEVQDIYTDFAECVLVDDNVSEKRPNVIVIMSEAFWNVNNLEGIVEASENPMDKYFELTEDAVTGQVAVNIYGGGTNKTEFEFLTGINTRYLSESNCYGEYYCRKQESMVTYMEELGYYTMAFHPYDREFWDRNIGYMNMGFEVFYSDKDFVNREMCHGYISDKSLTKEIIERFEERKDVQSEQPVFTFAVSVQNHVNDMEYFDESVGKVGCTGITTTVKGKDINDEMYQNVEEYYNGLRETIEALEELICYFEDYEEDTVIVFFGDHAPLFVNQICDTYGKENEMNLYRTPYMIWTNYENDYKSYGDINMSYLSSVLIEYLKLPKPNQYYVNKYMLENYPISTMYEQEYMEGLDEQRLIDMMSIVTSLHKRFPNEEMALPFWQIAE